MNPRPVEWRPRAAAWLRTGLVATLTIATVLLTGCAGGRFVRPTGPSAPFPEGAGVWNTLSRPCRGVTGARAELRVSGRIAGEGFPGLTTGLAVDPDRLAIVATYNTRPIFNLAGDASDVVLLDHMEDRVVRGPAADIVDALVGVRLTPARLLGLLSGCVSASEAVTSSERVGSVARLTTPDTIVYLGERDGEWRLLAAEFGDVTADYRRLNDGWPVEIELRRPDVRLTLRVIEFERNPQLMPALFRVRIPESYVEAPIETLQAGGPLGRREPQDPAEFR